MKNTIFQIFINIFLLLFDTLVSIINSDGDDFELSKDLMRIQNRWNNRDKVIENLDREEL